MPADLASSVLDVSGLRVSAGDVELIHGVSFTLRRGESLGLVGESGSGKSVTCRAVLGVLAAGTRVSGGTIEFEQARLDRLTAAQWLRVRGRVGAVFQDPASYLNPSLTVGRQLTETLRVRGGLTRQQARQRTHELLRLVGLTAAERVFRQIPAELSGGMQQRVMLAIAVALDPVLIVADEPTSALDVETQAEVIALLRDLRHRLGLSLILVSHDIDQVLGFCDRVAVFLDGAIVEEGTPRDLTERPAHQYTRYLLRAAGLPVPVTGAPESGETTDLTRA